MQVLRVGRTARRCEVYLVEDRRERARTIQSISRRYATELVRVGGAIALSQIFESGLGRKVRAP
jgi:hypothetical protein